MTASRAFRIASFVVVLAGVLVQVGCKRAAPPAPPAEPPLVQVDRIVPQTVPVPYEFIGQTEASQKVEIRSRVRGFLLKRAFEEGSPVKEGDLLFQIDPRSFESDLQMAEARLAQAQASLQQAEREIGRIKPLVSTKAVPERELDDWYTREAEARAAVRLAEAAAANARLDLSYTTIQSPLTGLIGLSDKDVGSLVDDGTNSYLATVTQIDPIYVTFTISEREVLDWERGIRTGEIIAPQKDSLPLEIVLADGRTYAQQGRLNFVDVRIDPATGTARLRASFPNPLDGRATRLIPGQFVRTRILGVQRVNAVAIPQSAVIFSATGTAVYTVNAESQVVSVPISLGSSLGPDVVVTAGLRGGELLITEGAQKVRPGMAVRVANAAPAEAKTVAPVADPALSPTGTSVTPPTTSPAKTSAPAASPASTSATAPKPQ